MTYEEMKQTLEHIEDALKYKTWTAEKSLKLIAGALVIIAGLIAIGTAIGRELRAISTQLERIAGAQERIAEAEDCRVSAAILDEHEKQTEEQP